MTPYPWPDALVEAAAAAMWDALAGPIRWSDVSGNIREWYLGRARAALNTTPLAELLAAARPFVEVTLNYNEAADEDDDPWESRMLDISGYCISQGTGRVLIPEDFHNLSAALAKFGEPRT